MGAIILVVYFATKRDATEGMTTNQLLFMAAIVWMIVGVMVAVVAGVGVFLDDLSPGLNGFWRSRPIQSGQWFIVKYVVGLLVTIVTLAVPLVAVVLYVWVAPDALANASIRDNLEVRNFVAIGGFGQVAVYNCAIAAIILLRRPIHAAFTAIVAALLTWVFPALMTEILAVPGGSQEVVILVFIGYAVVAVFIIAWMAVKHDWGWKT
jgi:hypothetical protein